MPIIEKALFSRSAKIDVTDREHRKQLREALARALNCWEPKPKWLLDLYDELSLEIHHDQVARSGRPKQLPQQVKT